MMRFKLSMITVEPFMFLCMHVFFLSLVAFPQITLDNVCLHKHNDTKCAAMFTGSYKEDYDIVQEQSTLWFGGLLVIATFITVLTLPFVGTVSDQFGRYTAMFLTPVSQLVQSLVMLGILLNGLKFPTWALLLPGFIPGLVGDVSGLYVLTGCYISDITSEKTRTLRITLLDSAAMLSGLSATLCSGFIIEGYGYVGIFVTNIAFLVLALLYLIFCVNPVNNKKDESSRQANVENQEVSSHMEKHGEQIATTDVREKVDVEEVEDVLRTDKSDGALDDCRSSPRNTRGREHATTGDIAYHRDVAEKEETKLDSDIGNWHLLMNDVQEERNDKTEAANGEKKVTMQSNDVLSTTNFTNDDNRPLSLSNETDQYAKGDITKTGSKPTTGHFTNTPNFDTAALEPQVEVFSKMEYENVSSCSKLFHILKESNPIQNFKRVHNLLKAENQMFNGLILYLLMFVTAISYSGEMAVMALYLKNRPYFLSSRDLGLYLAYESGIIAILGMAILNFLFTRILKINDHLLLLIAFCFYILYFILLSVAQSLRLLYLIQLLHSVASLSTCIIRSLLSKIVPASAIGLIFGALLIVETTGILLGSLISPVIYSSVLATYPGAVFFFNVGLSLFNIVVTAILRKENRDREIRLG